MSGRISSDIKIGAATLSILLLCANALPEFVYDSQIPSLPFTVLGSRAVCELPVKDKVTLFYFEYSPQQSKVDFLLALTNCIPQHRLSVYAVVLDSVKESGHGLVTVIPNTDFFEPIKQMAAFSRADIVLLIDQERRLKYAGPIGSFQKFMSILQKLGLDLSIDQPDVDILVARAAKLRNVHTQRILTRSEFDRDGGCKIILFYRSLCLPCGEQTLLRQIYDLVQSHSEWELSMYLVFRNFDADKMENILGDFFYYENTYIPKQISPELERYFMSGNPYIVVFSPENEFLKAGIGNKMSMRFLQRFLAHIAESSPCSQSFR